MMSGNKEFGAYISNNMEMTITFLVKESICFLSKIILSNSNIHDPNGLIIVYIVAQKSVPMFGYFANTWHLQENQKVLTLILAGSLTVLASSCPKDESLIICFGCHGTEI